MMKFLHLLLFPVFLQCSVHAADWPQWRGANRDDHSPDKAILEKWPAAGPERLWMSTEAGLGYSGFSIAGGQLFTMGAAGDAEQVLALDAATGKKLWAAKLDDRVYPNNWGDGPRSTPTVDGDRLYALSASGVLGCLSVKDGAVLWKVDLVSDLGGKLQSWGYTESVLVDGDRVICTPGGAQGTMAALNKMTGKVIWRTKELQDEAQYSSPILVDHAGQRQYVQLISRKIFSVNPESGAVLWKMEFPGRVAVIPTPIYHDGHIYVTAGYSVGCQLLKLGAPGRDPEVVYENNTMVNHHGGVILVDGKVYGHSDKGGWTCQDFLTGNAVWQDKTLGKGACAYAAGNLVCVDENNGTVVLVAASPEGWKEKSRFKLDPQTKLRKKDGRIWTHPVILDGRLYLRDQDLIFCYNIKPA